jgi:glycosyltransferase involved in cell wall biosynthesis
MRVALVHELLTIRGGAERVLKVFADMFPEAPIYTFLYDEQKLGDLFPKERVRTSRLQKWAGLSTNHHLYLSKFPAAAEAWDFSEFDLVIGSSSAFAHGIITNGKPKHLCYVHSPARYLWDRTHDILEKARSGPLGALRYHYLSSTFHRLRTWDAESADRPDMLLAASAEVQRRIQLYWRRESEVVHPPIRDFWLEEGTSSNDKAMSYERSAMSQRNISSSQSSQLKAHSYFLIVSTLADYKRIDLAVQACNDAKVPLKIAGDGRALASLRHIAGPTIEFLGHRNDAQLKDLYAKAKAVLFPGDEDFGLVPLEAQACGTPVIAYRSGGALETVKEGVTGAFFDDNSASSLEAAIRSFDHKKYSDDACRSNANTHSESAFVHTMNSAIKRLMSEG